MGIPGALLTIAFWSVIVPVCLSVAMVLFSEFFYTIGVLLFSIIDLLQMIFRKLAGLGTVWMTSSTGGTSEQIDGDILVALLKNPTIIDTLISVTVFAVALTIIATIVQMIRVEYTTEGSKNSKEGIIGLGLKSLVMFVLIPVVCFFGIRLSNYMLKAVDAATSSSNTSSLAGAVFNAATVDANRIANNLDDGISLGDINISGLLAYIGGDSGGYRHAKLNKDSNGSSSYYVLNFENTLNSSQTDVTKARQEIGKKIDSLMAMNTSQAKWMNSDGFGEGKVVVLGTMNYINVSAVGYFYSIGKINFIILYFGCYLVLQSLFNASVGLIVRLYKVAALFVIAPATIGLQPIDGGNAFKTWKKSFISNVVSAYGVVVAFNLFFILVGVITKIELWNPDLWSSYTLNKFMQALFAVVGITQIKSLIKDIGGYVGAADIMADGAGAVGEATKAVGSVAKVGVGVAMGGASIYNKVKALKEKAKANKIDKTADDKNYQDKIDDIAAGAKYNQVTGVWTDASGMAISDDRLDKLNNIKQKHDKAKEAQASGKTDMLRKRASYHSAKGAFQSSTVGGMMLKSGPASTLMGLTAGSTFKSFSDGKMFEDEFDDFNEKHGGLLTNTGVQGKSIVSRKLGNVVGAISGEKFTGRAARDSKGNKIIGENGYAEKTKHAGRITNFQNATRGVVNEKNDAEKSMSAQHNTAQQTFAQTKADYRDKMDSLVSNYAENNSLAGMSVKSATMTQENKAAYELLNLSSSGNLDVGTIKARALAAQGGDDYSTLNPNYSKAIDNLVGANASNVASLVDELKKAFVEDSKDESLKAAYKDLEAGSAKVDNMTVKENDAYKNNKGKGVDGLSDYAKELQSIMNNNALKLDEASIRSLLENHVIKTKEEGDKALNINFDKLKSIIADALKADKDNAQAAKAAADQAKATAEQTKLLQDLLKEFKKKK